MNRPVLLVEDDENDIFFMLDAFRRAGITNPIQVVRDGRQAVNYLKGSGQFGDRSRYPLPDIVLLDLKLPYIMGLEVLRSLRQELHLLVAVIILSASMEPIDVANAYQLGANAYLVKPSDVTRLYGMVRAIHDFWLNYNTAAPA